MLRLTADRLVMMPPYATADWRFRPADRRPIEQRDNKHLE